MMEVITGGQAQGKLDAARREHPDYIVRDGEQIPLPACAIRSDAGTVSGGAAAVETSGDGNLCHPSESDPDCGQNLRDGITRTADHASGQGLILDHVHVLIRRMLQEGYTQDQIITALEQSLATCPDLVLISDEIGCGIVPMDASERQWREVTGRVMTAMAARADRVERVVCGLVQILK